MANPEHLAILMQGVKTWNQWRKDHPRVIPRLDGANLRGRSFAAPAMSNRLVECDFSNTVFRGANLRFTNFCQSNCWNADFSHAGLHGAKFTEASLVRARLVGACLQWAEIDSSSLNDADLTEAKIVYMGLRRSDLKNANFTRATIHGTVFAEVDLSVCRGLDTMTHEGPSVIGIESLFQSGGRIPEPFLRGAGLPDVLITYARSLTGQALDCNSCFISYSSKDQVFAERTHADLQATGVRCWFAPEDLRIGDPFRQRIDESIRVHDKLLLILSENSVQSTWVQDEVEAALERERRENRPVLFPIRIDDAVMDTDCAWASSIRRTRHIGDFTRWKDHDSYQKAFERLLRDLKAEESNNGR